MEAFIILTEKWNCMEPNGLDIPVDPPKTSKVMVQYVLGSVTSVKVVILLFSPPYKRCGCATHQMSLWKGGGFELWPPEGAADHPVSIAR